MVDICTRTCVEGGHLPVGRRCRSSWKRSRPIRRHIMHSDRISGGDARVPWTEHPARSQGCTLLIDRPPVSPVFHYFVRLAPEGAGI